MTFAAPPDVSPGSRERALLERAVHDLKNPLSVVRATLEWLEVELADREDALDAVRDAAVASERIMTIADDLDALARIGEEGRRSDRVAVLPLVAAVAAAANEKLARRGVSVLASLTAGSLHTMGDERLFARSLTALVDSTSRGAARGACIEISVLEAAAAIEIHVALRGAVDAPVGAEAESTLPVLETSGLGVYVALRVFQAHRGTLQLVPTMTLPRMIVRLPRDPSP